MGVNTARELSHLLLDRLERSADHLTIDADTHATDLSQLERPADYFHGRPVSADELVAEMDMARVDMALTWQNPAATLYQNGDLDGNAEALLAANRYILDSALRFPGRFIPAGWVDPRNCGLDHALQMTDTLVCEFRFLFVKFNPAQNEYRLDSGAVFKLVERILELGAIPAFHFGADTPYTPADALKRLADACGEAPLLAIHMGGGGAGYVEAEDLYVQARRIGLEHPNVRFVFSAKRDTHIETDLITYELAGEPFRSNLMCASDAPYGRMSWNFGGFRLMFETLMDSRRHTDPRIRANPGLFTPEVAQRYLGGNFARLAAAGYRQLVALHDATAPAACR